MNKEKCFMMCVEDSCPECPLHARIAELEAELERLKSQQPPCSPECYHHQTHPCEKCGRISGFLPKEGKI